jgi:hypothetical protein
MSVGIGSPHAPPPPQASVSPPLDPGGGGKQQSLAGEGVRDPIRTTKLKAWPSAKLCWFAKGNPEVFRTVVFVHIMIL